MEGQRKRNIRREAAPSKEQRRAARDTSVKSTLHASVRKGKVDKTAWAKEQSKGYCIFCPGKFSAPFRSQIDRHFLSVHAFKAVYADGHTMLFCKCSEVPDKGQDKFTRNAHYHCYKCQQPVEGKQGLYVHLVKVHEVPQSKLPQNW